MRAPDEQCYSRQALFLIARPDLIRDPVYTSAIVEMLKQLVAARPPADTTAAQVDFWINGGKGYSLEDARKAVVQATGKTYGAVKKAHQRKA
jgi:hypothetical protein